MLRSEGSKAIRSIPAYVERSDFISISFLQYHDRKVPDVLPNVEEDMLVSA